MLFLESVSYLDIFCFVFVHILEYWTIYRWGCHKVKPQKAEENIFNNFSSFVVDRGAQVWENLCCQLISWLEPEMSFLKFFLLLSPYFFNVNTTFTSAKQYAPSVHLMFELCRSQVFSSFEFKIARAKILLETFSELYANKGDFILELFFGGGLKAAVLDSILPACIMW